MANCLSDRAARSRRHSPSCRTRRSDGAFASCSKKGWDEAAQKELEIAISLDAKYADAYFNLAVVPATKDPPENESVGKYYLQALKLGAEPDESLEQLIK